ncbi:hypothetical protein BGZ83_010458 [Gryganskiella cystojenkinii]|nr:hypothetical protein BGZ83_010458 [Gryganskiella cystojenkinii]
MSSSATESHDSHHPIPRVLIAGAGLGGLFLAIALDRAGIPYDIYERAPKVPTTVTYIRKKVNVLTSSMKHNLGSFMGLNANILPSFEQLGLYEEFDALALPNSSVQFLYGSMKQIASLSSDVAKDPIGYDYNICSRIRLHELLLSKVPKERVHFNKKIVATVQTKDKVTIDCADGTTYQGDILVGADGAYSAVRQSLFKDLQDQNRLPAIDTQEMNKGYTCLVGTTDPLDPIKYPLIKDGKSEFHQIIGEGSPYSWTVFNVHENRLCYMVICQLSSIEESGEDKIKNAEWGPEHSSDMMQKVKNFKVPHGLTLGDLFELTPREKISRVYLEDKLFETWHHGRTVLIGDAAHKLLPSAGQGAICAMQDAVILANCLYDLKSLEYDSIKTALKDYQEQRYPQVKIQFDQSNFNAFLYHGQTLLERCARYFIFNWLPQSLTVKSIVKEASYRPQLTFLPLAKQRGTSTVQPQKPSWRYEEEQNKRKVGEVQVANKTSAGPATV